MWQLKVKIIDGENRALYQEKGYPGDAGFDLYCVEDQIIKAHTFSNKIDLGVQISLILQRTLELGPGYNHVINFERSCFLYPRSSLGSKTPLRLANSVGIIDAGYRGNIMAIVDNLSDEDFTIKKGDRWFQICAPNLEKMTIAFLGEDENFPIKEGERGAKGFGSTSY